MLEERERENLKKKKKKTLLQRTCISKIWRKMVGQLLIDECGANKKKELKQVYLGEKTERQELLEEQDNP